MNLFIYLFPIIFLDFEYKLDKYIWELPLSDKYSYYSPDIMRYTSQGIFVLYKKGGFVFHFDESGKIHGHFGRPGNGPGEINRMVMNLQLKDQELIILHQNGRIDFLSLDGEYIKSEKPSRSSGERLLYREGGNEFYVSRQRGGKKSIVWTMNGVEQLKESFVMSDSMDRVNGIHQLKLGPFLFFCNQNSTLGEIHYLVFHLEKKEIWDKGEFSSRALKIIKPKPPENIPINAILYHRVLVGFSVSDKFGFVLTNDSRGKLEHPEKGKYEILDTYKPKSREWEKHKIFNVNGHSFSFFQHLSDNHWIALEKEKGSFVRITIAEAL